jgi:hypothetical protein
MAGTPAMQSEAVQGVLAALRSLNAASVYYAQVFDAWPRFNQSVARILNQPLDSLELDVILDVAVLQVVPGHD